MDTLSEICTNGIITYSMLDSNPEGYVVDSLAFESQDQVFVAIKPNLAPDSEWQLGRAVVHQGQLKLEVFCPFATYEDKLAARHEAEMLSRTFFDQKGHHYLRSHTIVLSWSGRVKKAHR